MLIFGEGGGDGTYPCPDGGTLTVALNDTEPLGVPSPGDSATITFGDCEMNFHGEMVRVVGSYEITVMPSQVTQLAQTPPFVITLSLTFNDTVVHYPDETITLNGVMTVVYRSQDGKIFTTELSGALLTATVQETGQAPYTLELIDYDLEYLDNTDTGNYLMGFRGSLYHGGFGPSGATFDFESTTVLAGVAPNYPGSGIWYIDALGGRCVYIVQDTTTVRMQIDINGDGTPELTRDVPWTALW